MKEKILLLIQILCFALTIQKSVSSTAKWNVEEGKVLELDDRNFESAISSFDHIFVDFYAPWCGHCKRLAPELDAAAPVLAKLKKPIVIAKVNADKYTKLASKYDIDGYPTLMVFIHGVPMDYRGPRQADLLVRYLKKFVAPDVSVLDSDSAIKDFVEDAGLNFPVFIGFGLDETKIAKLAAKHKKKAWFSVAHGYSDDVMVQYDFDKVPALVSLHPSYNEQNIFYGPFEEEFLEEFITQNFLPLAVPMNHETLKVLKDDKRKIALSIVNDASEDKSRELIKVLKSAASANRDLVFGYVGIKQWAEFAETFGTSKKEKLPKMVIWDGDEEYLTVIGLETIDEEDMGTQVSRFLERYREGRTETKKISGPSLIGFINSLIGFGTIYIIVFIVAVMMILRSLKEEPLTVGTGEQADRGTSSEAQQSERRTGEKED